MQGGILKVKNVLRYLEWIIKKLALFDFQIFFLSLTKLRRENLIRKSLLHPMQMM